MSGPIDEEFTERHVQPGTVLEFGCSPGVFTSRLAKRRDLIVTGIDLYPAEQVDGYTFVQGDVMAYKPQQTFDTICCVSSFEHCGVETANFALGAQVDLDYHINVAKKLVSLLAPTGRLIVTCPLGPDEVWLTRKGAADFKFGEALLSSAQWGYRTFTIPTLERLFALLSISIVEGYAHLDGDYFDRRSWAPIDPFHKVEQYNSPQRRAVMGAVFERPKNGDPE